MQDRKEYENSTISAEYVVIGSGPAAICAVAKLYGSGVAGNKIIWVDPQFKVGDFGTKLSIGSSVPGNTTVESYQKVNNAIYTLIPACAPTVKEITQFEMTSLASDTTCSLRVAAQPLQYITNNLRMLVHSVEGTVSAIDETKDGIRLDIKSTDSTTRCALAKRVILAVGAEPRTMQLPNHVTKIDPNVTFIESELKRYLNENPNIKTVAVIGSSHSAALATMHLLQAGIAVKQFMNKEYKFATPTTTSDGTRYTQFDNTGLKGKVARFTHQLLNDKRMHEKWECHIGENVDALLATHLSGCTHAVACIGYKPTSSLQINGLPLTEFKHDRHSTQMQRADGKPVSGMFGIGVAFPPEVKAISGEVEAAVGVGKFWACINDKIFLEWKNHPTDHFFRSTALQHNGMFGSVPANRDTITPIQTRAKL